MKLTKDDFITFGNNDGCETISCKRKFTEQILKNQEDVEKIKKIIEHGLAEDGFDDLPEDMCFNIQKILDG